MEDGAKPHSRSASRSSTRLSFGGEAGGGGGKSRVGFADNRVSVRSSRSFSLNGGTRTIPPATDPRDRSLTPATAGTQAQRARNSPDPNPGGSNHLRNDYGAPQERMLAGEPGSSDEELGSSTPEMRDLEGMRNMQTPEPVSRPPAFNHGPQAHPANKAYHSPELRRANSRLSSTTLAQLAKAGGISGADDMPPRRDGGDGVLSGPSVYPHANPMEASANDYGHGEALSRPMQDRLHGNLPLPPPGIPNQRSRSPMGHPHHGPPSTAQRGDTDYPARPHTSDGRRSPYPPGPPRPQNQQHPSHQPVQTRLPPSGSPGGPPPPQGRGRPNQRPPPGNDSPYRDQHGNYGPGLVPRPYPGSHGRGGPPPISGHPQRKPVPHNSITPNDIIEHYVSNSLRGAPPASGERPPPPPPKHGPGFSGQDSQYSGPPNMDSGHAGDARGPVHRPRAGVLKTVGGGEPHKRPGFDIPEVNFGPTVNYGAPSVLRKNAPLPGEPVIPGQARMQHPPEQGPNYAKLQSSGSEPRHARQDSEDRAKRTMAWQPGGSYAGSGTAGLTPEQFVQQRHGGAVATGGPGGTNPRPPHHAVCFPGPTRPGAQAPPEGQYDPAPGGAQNARKTATQFQGQVF